MAPSPRIPRPLLPSPLSYNSVQAPSRVMESPQLKSKWFSKATAPSGASAKHYGTSASSGAAKSGSVGD
jgi:hypothetical protein